MSRANPVLVLTKLRIPPLRPQLVERARLFDLTPDQAVTRLVLVSAPAGFGKTVFLAEWCRALSSQADYAVAWYLLDEGDNDPVRFVTYLVVALSQALGKRGDFKLALEAVEASGDASAGVDVDYVLTLLLNSLATAASKCVLVLDDYHVISSPAVHAALTFLLDNLPAQMRVAIGTRADPPLQLARLRVCDQLVEVRAIDLRFTLAETLDFFSTTLNLALSKQEIQAVEACAEGWAAGLQLITLALKQGSFRPGEASVAEFIARFSASQRSVFDYLTDEVFERQLPDVQHFLLDTSVLDRLSGPLCDAVADRTGSATVLDELYRANLFVISLDEEQSWYRYHYLFGRFLRERLARQWPDKAAELNRRASAWYEREEALGEAIKHALAASDFDRAVRLTERLPATQRPSALAEPLSTRELQVLRLLAKGASNQDVAAALVISLSTVKVHVHRILSKLGAANRTEAVARARAAGLV